MLNEHTEIMDETAFTPCILRINADNLCNGVATMGLSLFTVCGISGGIYFIGMWHCMTLIQIQLHESILQYCTGGHAVKWQVDLYCTSSIWAQSEITFRPDECSHINVMYCKESFRFGTLCGNCWSQYTGCHSTLYLFGSSNCCIVLPCMSEVSVNSGCRLWSFSRVARLWLCAPL